MTGFKVYRKLGEDKILELVPLMSPKIGITKFKHRYDEFLGYVGRYMRTNNNSEREEVEKQFGNDFDESNPRKWLIMGADGITQAYRYRYGTIGWGNVPEVPHYLFRRRNF